MGISQFGKEPSEEAINLIANGDMTQIQNLVEGFKKDIRAKDVVLKSRDEAIQKLQKEFMRKEEELLNHRSKNEEDLQRNIEKVCLKFLILILTFLQFTKITNFR